MLGYIVSPKPAYEKLTPTSEFLLGMFDVSTARIVTDIVHIWH